MPNIFDGFSGFASMGNVIYIIGMIILWLIIGVGIVFLMIFIMIRLNEKTIIEINIENKRLQMMKGREKRTADGSVQLFIPKLKKLLPKLQSNDLYLKGKNDVIILLKDNNGLHHTLRIPTVEELTDFFLYKYGVDLEVEAEEIRKQDKLDAAAPLYHRGIFQRLKDKFKNNPVIGDKLDIIESIYLLPNPSEDIDWLSHKCISADKKFVGAWWQNPSVVWIATLGIMVIFTIMWFIVIKKV